MYQLVSWTQIILNFDNSICERWGYSNFDQVLVTSLSKVARLYSVMVSMYMLMLLEQLRICMMLWGGGHKLTVLTEVPSLSRFMYLYSKSAWWHHSYCEGGRCVLFLVHVLPVLNIWQLATRSSSSLRNNVMMHSWCTVIKHAWLLSSLDPG